MNQNAEVNKQNGFVFISYARVDRPRLEWVLTNLKSARHRLFIDKEMPIGSRWESILKQKIAECACLLVVWTKESIHSEWVIREVDEALRLNKKIVPVRLDPIQPADRFSKFNIADLTKWNGNSDYSEWKKVLEHIGPSLSKNVVDPVRIASQLKSHYGVSVSPVQNQSTEDSLALSGQVHEIVIRAYSREEFYQHISAIGSQSYALKNAESQVAIYEKTNSFNWWLAIVLAFLFVLPLLIYIQIYRRSPKLERIRVVLIEA
jgi:hypothetical protein